jgi:hypothetical protein
MFGTTKDERSMGGGRDAWNCTEMKWYIKLYMSDQITVTIGFTRFIRKSVRACNRWPAYKKKISSCRRVRVRVRVTQLYPPARAVEL